MDNLYSQQDAQTFIAKYPNEAIALRVYTSRLLGANPKLVLHGGGNTSVKTTSTNLLGETIDVICVKGSGWDLASIEPAGLPALKLEPLLRLRTLKELTDEAMVNFQRSQLLSMSSPNPSIETLLHAFLPHRFIDHTHANAILSLTNQPDGEAIIKKVFGKTFGIVRYIKPGFDLAKLAAEVYEQDQKIHGLILLHHGIFTFADTAEESYTRMIDAVTLAEKYISSSLRAERSNPAAQNTGLLHPCGVRNDGERSNPADIAPKLRGACAQEVKPKQYQRMVVCHRQNDDIFQYVNGKSLERYSQQGAITPDHTIRTKILPLIVPTVDAIDSAVEAYKKKYHQYFERNNNSADPKIELDPMPRIVLMPGVGLFTLGKTAKEANINADIAENTIKTILDAERIGRYTALDEALLFEMEYWSLEQAKLAKQVEKPFTRQVVVITGSAGTIGAATATTFADLGADIALLDIDEERCMELAKSLNPFVLPIGCDVTDPVSVKKAFQQICETFGGVDIVVFNAGRAFKGVIGEVEDATLRQSFEINFFAHQLIAQHAVAIMQQQKTGGNLLFNVSKQALNPGPDFGPYGIAKAATLALVRQYALEYAADGIRANAVNADRIRSGLLTEEMIVERAGARGVSVETYMRGNLLQLEVTAEDVAQAFVHQALAQKTTAAITTVDGGNMAAAVR